jgi:hypothetical protein
MITAEFIGENFKELTSSYSIQISKTKDNEYNFGIMPKELIGTIFENPGFVYLEKMTLSELVELANGLSLLVKRIESTKSTE